MVTTTDWRRRLTAPTVGDVSWRSRATRSPRGRLDRERRLAGVVLGPGLGDPPDRLRRGGRRRGGAHHARRVGRRVVAGPAGRRMRPLDGHAVRRRGSRRRCSRGSRTCGCRGSRSWATPWRPASPTTTATRSSCATARNRHASSTVTSSPPASAGTGRRDRAGSRPTPRCSRSGTRSPRTSRTPPSECSMPTRASSSARWPTKAWPSSRPAGRPCRAIDRLVVVREIGGFARPWIWSPGRDEPQPDRVRRARCLSRSPTGTPTATPCSCIATTRRRTAWCRSISMTGPCRRSWNPAARSTAPGSGPTDSVWFRHQDGVRPPAWRDAATGEQVLHLADPPPAGRAWEAIWFDNPAGDRIQGWFLRPEGSRPVPHGRLGARRPQLPQHRRVRAASAGLRRRGLRRAPRELPRFDGIRTRVPPSPLRQRRLPGVRGHQRRARSRRSRRD